MGEAAKIYHMPEALDREAVETAMQVYLYAEQVETKERMLKCCKVILEKYGLRKMRISDYTLRINWHGGVSISTNVTATEPYCPKCGAYIYNEFGPVDLIHYHTSDGTEAWNICGCRCGAVFRIWVGR